MDPAQDVSGLSPTVHLGKGPSQLTGAMLKNWIKTKLTSGTFFQVSTFQCAVKKWNVTSSTSQGTTLPDD